MNLATSDIFFQFNKYLSRFFFQFQMEETSNNYFSEQVNQTQF